MPDVEPMGSRLTAFVTPLILCSGQLVADALLSSNRHLLFPGGDVPQGRVEPVAVLHHLDERILSTPKPIRGVAQAMRHPARLFRVSLPLLGTAVKN
jgi:hypothetical protein